MLTIQQQKIFTHTHCELKELIWHVDRVLSVRHSFCYLHPLWCCNCYSNCVFLQQEHTEIQNACIHPPNFHQKWYQTEVINLISQRHCSQNISTYNFIINFILLVKMPEFKELLSHDLVLCMKSKSNHFKTQWTIN